MIQNKSEKTINNCTLSSYTAFSSYTCKDIHDYTNTGNSSRST